MRDVLGAKDLGGETLLKGQSERGGAVRLQERMEPLDVSDPDARATVRQLGEICVRRRAELEQVLALEIAFAAFPGHGGDELRPMFGQRRRRIQLDEPRMARFEAAGDDPY